MNVAFYRFKSLANINLRDLRTLKKFVLSGNQVKVLYQMYVSARHLSHLECKSLKLQSIGDGFFTNFDQLMQLDLSDNNLSSIHE